MSIVKITDEIEDLWGDLNFINPPKIKSPLTILEEQGQLLLKKTNGLLEGEVYSFTHPSSKTVHYVFLIKAKKIDYKTSLFHTVRPLSQMYPYPVEVSWPRGNNDEQIEKITTEEEYIKKVKFILQHQKTKDLLHRLASQMV